MRDAAFFFLTVRHLEANLPRDVRFYSKIVPLKLKMIHLKREICTFPLFYESEYDQIPGEKVERSGDTVSVSE